MLKITVNCDKQNIVHSCALGQVFPNVNGKLIQLEINGKELMKLSEQKEIPICSIDTSYLIWHGKAAGHILNLLREIWTS